MGRLGRVFLYVLVFIISLYIICLDRTLVYATSTFEDDFSVNLDNWDLIDDGYTQVIGVGTSYGLYGWYLEDGKLFGEAGYNETSLLTLDIGKTFSYFDFTCDAMNINGVDQSFWLKMSEDGSSYYEINYRYNEPDWPQDHNKISFRKVNNGVQEYFTQVDMGTNGLPNLNPGQQYRLRLYFNENGEISIYLDDLLVYQYLDSSPLPAGKIIFRNWGGNFNSYTMGRVKNVFDNVKLDYVPESTSVDTDTKVVILPGLGASWNPLGVMGISDPNLVWSVPPFIHVYDNLVRFFEANGYVKDQNLFVWGYDWRRPVNEITTNFDSYISSITDSNDKIILIGHSLGGLVARSWYQNNLLDNRIEKVVSLGSPHQGAVDAYEVWAGGQVSSRGLLSVLLNILILLNKDVNETRMSVIHEYAPVVNNLQPVFDFAYREAQLLPYSSMTDFNSVLTLKNNDIGVSQLDNLHTIGGKSIATSQFVSLTDRSFFDKRLGLWPDGRIAGITTSDFGDGTVLISSALMGPNYYEFNSGHRELTTTSISTLQSILGLGETGVISEDDSDDSLIFYIASPAHLEITCGLNTFQSDSMGFAIIDRSIDFNECQVNVVADGGGGDYKLVVGNSSSDEWSIYKSNVMMGEVDSYVFGKGGLLVSQNNIYKIYKKHCQELLVDYPGDTDLLKCVSDTDSKNGPGLVNDVFDFQARVRVNTLSFEMINMLIPVISESDVSKTSAEWFIKNGKDMFKLVDMAGLLKEKSQIDTDDFGVDSYALASDVFKFIESEFDSEKYGDVKARFELTRRLLKQVW